jgi:hypothetical protein
MCTFRNVYILNSGTTESLIHQLFQSESTCLFDADGLEHLSESRACVLDHYIRVKHQGFAYRYGKQMEDF